MSAPIDPRLTALGFKPAAANVRSKRRMFITTEGATSAGKTDFLRRCPPPVVVVDFDRGMEGVAETDIWGNEILRKTIDMPDLDMFGKTTSPGERQIATASYAEFKKLMHDVLSLDIARTLAVETGGHAYSLAQIARFGQIAQLGEVPAAMWTAMQAEYEGIFLEYEKYHCNLIVSHRQGSKFMGLPGDKELKGYKQMQYLSQVHLNFEKRPVRDDRGKAIDFELVRTIVKCRQRLALETPTHPQHEFPVMFLDDDKQQSVGGDFLTIAKAVFPNTTDADWI
jgi:hypothetical protein